MTTHSISNVGIPILLNQPANRYVSPFLPHPDTSIRESPTQSDSIHESFIFLATGQRPDSTGVRPDFQHRPPDASAGVGPGDPQIGR